MSQDPHQDFILDEESLAAYRALQGGDWQGALARADRALGHPELSARPALEARLQAWAAQCWLLGGDAREARLRLSKALAVNRAAGDA